MQITPLIPDGYNGPVKRLTCTLCRRAHYMALADYEAMQPVSYCHECSIMLLAELEKVKDAQERTSSRRETVRRISNGERNFHAFHFPSLEDIPSCFYCGSRCSSAKND